MTKKKQLSKYELIEAANTWINAWLVDLDFATFSKMISANFKGSVEISNENITVPDRKAWLKNQKEMHFDNVIKIHHILLPKLSIVGHNNVKAFVNTIQLRKGLGVGEVLGDNYYHYAGECRLTFAKEKGAICLTHYQGHSSRKVFLGENPNLAQERKTMTLMYHHFGNKCHIDSIKCGERTLRATPERKLHYSK